MIAYFQVRYRKKNTMGTWTSVDLPQGQTTINIPGLEIGVEYEFGVRAIDTDGSISGWSTQPAPPVLFPDVPTNLTGSSATSGIQLTWTETNLQPMTQYLVQSIDQDPNGPTFTSWGFAKVVSSMSYIYSTTATTPVWFRVAARNSAGTSAFTAAISVAHTA